MRFFPALFLILTGVLCAQDAPSLPKQRVKSIHELAKEGSPAIPKIAPYLQDDALEVRIEALETIVSLGTQYSLDPLIEATKDPDAEMQIRATDGLVNFYVPGYVKSGVSGTIKRVNDSVTGMFTDTNDQIVPPSMMVRPEIIDALIPLINTGSSLTSRANAARAAGILRGKAAVPALADALRSKDDRLMYECLVALRKIADKSAGPRVVFLLHDMDEKVQVAAIEDAGVLDVQSAAPELRRVLETTTNKKVRRASLSSLAMLPAPENRELILPYLTDKDENLRSSAAEGLGRIADKRDIAALQDLFDTDKRMLPHLSSAFALVYLGKTEVNDASPLGHLMGQLNSKSYRGVALPFLCELVRMEEVRRPLYGAMQSPMTADQKTGLASALGQSRARDALEPLQTLAKDTDPQVSLAATQGLTLLRSSI
jgi:HEAT repeat protein